MDGTLGLGANVGNRWGFLRLGLDGLARSGVGVLAASDVWETRPVDAPPQPWFLNMVVAIRTDLAPEALLEALMGVELRAGRTRQGRNTARTLDLDLLSLGQSTRNTDRLELPHPRMWDRPFVVVPLAEVAPEMRDPRTGRTAEQLRTRLILDGGLVCRGPLAPG